jgi:DNA-binding NtrC family response regulator
VAQVLHSLSLPVKDAPTVLIAEDEVLIRFALYEGLTDRGVRVLEAGTAAEAIHVLEEEPEIDLVFTDIRMPGPLNGLDVVRWIHSHRPGTPVLLTSGGVHRADLAADIDADKPFIAKPYDLDSVVARITDLAREYQHHR